MNKVRQQYLDSKESIVSLLNSFKSEFDDQSEFNRMFKFMEGFYEIIEDEKKFNKQIVNKARTK